MMSNNIYIYIYLWISDDGVYHWNVSFEQVFAYFIFIVILLMNVYHTHFILKFKQCLYHQEHNFDYIHVCAYIYIYASIKVQLTKLERKVNILLVYIYYEHACLHSLHRLWSFVALVQFIVQFSAVPPNKIMILI